MMHATMRRQLVRCTQQLQLKLPAPIRILPRAPPHLVRYHGKGRQHRGGCPKPLLLHGCLATCKCSRRCGAQCCEGWWDGGGCHVYWGVAQAVVGQEAGVEVTNGATGGR